MDLYGLSIVVILYQKVIYLTKQIRLNPLIELFGPMFYKKNSSKGFEIDNRLYLLQEVKAK